MRGHPKTSAPSLAQQLANFLSAGDIHGLDDLIRRITHTTRVHDDPMPGDWFCGRCPYTNFGGDICTKCGAPRHEGHGMASGPFGMPGPRSVAFHREEN
jgi:hypothetical protein